MNCCDEYGECTRGKDCPARPSQCCNDQCEQGHNCPVPMVLIPDHTLEVVLVCVWVATFILFAVYWVGR